MKGMLILVTLLLLGTIYGQNYDGFLMNKGQWDDQAILRKEVADGFFWVDKNGFTVEQLDHSIMHDLHLTEEKAEKKTASLKGHVLKYSFATNEDYEIDARIDADNSCLYNFILGNNPAKWVKGLRAHKSVYLKDFLKEGDLEVVSQGQGVKYNIHLAAGADARNFSFKIEGAEKMLVNKSGSLVVHTSIGAITESIPVVYQEIHGKRYEVEASYALEGNQVGFVLGEYNERYPLVIDPVLIFATYSGSFSDNFGMTATYDNDGNAFSGGTAFGNQFPTTPGAYDITSNFPGISGNYGITDVVITKYTGDGTARIFSTYIGGGDGAQGTETVHSLIADEDQNIYFFGVTSSTDYPTTPGAIQSTHAGGDFVGFVRNGAYFYTSGTDLYISKISADGSTLMGSTYLGGSENDGINYNRNFQSGGNFLSNPDSLQYNYGDQFRGEIMLDTAGNVYIASCTRSLDFPTQSAFQTILQGHYNAVVAKMSNNLDNLIYSTYLGGSERDAAYSVKINSQNQAVVAGGTASSDFPMAGTPHTGSFQGGKADGFISVLSENGASLIASTYVGTSVYDQNYFVELDRTDRIFVVGQTEGSFPVSPGVYSNPGSAQYIARYSGDLSALEASTVFGNGSNDPQISPSAFLVDFCGNVYVSGWGADILQSTPLNGMPVTPDAYQASNGDGFNFYLIVLEREFQDILYGSYIGGPQAQEHVDGGTSRFDKYGIVYQSVCGGCGGNSDFPTTPGAVSGVNNSSNCNNLVFKFDFEIAPDADFTVDQTQGCIPLTVTFENFSTQGDDYLWNFGNGDTSTVEFNPVRTYTTPGTYEVWLYVTDSVCNLTDSAVQVITVYEALDVSAFGDTVICPGDIVPIGAGSPGGVATYTWATDRDFVDVINPGGDSVITVTPTASSWYYVKGENAICEDIDSVQVELIPDLVAVTGDLVLCTGTIGIISVSNNSGYTISAVTWTDTTGNIIATGPDYPYDEDSSFVVDVILNFANGCDITLTQYVAIIQGPGTDVFIDASADTVLVGTEVQLTAYPNGYSYEWLSPSVSDPTAQTINYEVNGDVTAAVVIDFGNCTDTGYYQLKSFEFECEEPYIFLPNAFTPNGDGNNDVLYLRGKYLDEVLLRVFDRWGNLLFETEDQNVGWDGTYKGADLKPDVYMYYYKVRCAGGELFEKKGDVTIIR